MHTLVITAQQDTDAGSSMAEICRRFTGLVKKHAYQPHLKGLHEDAMGEGWLAVVQAVRSFQPAAGVPVAGYIESRVKFAVWNLFKRERRRWEREMSLNGGGDDDEGGALPLLNLLAADADVPAAVEAKLNAVKVRQALSGLPEKQRLALTRTLLTDQRLKDVAGELGVSVQAIHNLRQRGLARLKKSLAGMYESERG